MSIPPDPAHRAGAPTIGVLALQGDVREHVRMLEAVGAHAVAVRRPQELDRLDGLVVPGGESTTMWRLARSFDLLEPLRKRVGGGLPVYGSCAGMIMLADGILDGADGQETIGGLDMVVRRNAFGRQIDSFEAPVEIDGVPGEPLTAVFIRAPWVESVGGRARVLGRIAGAGGGPARIVAVRQDQLLATSFHPELTGDTRIHELFVKIVKGQA
ncbi:pyridoxal 5'-phosphate synthase glutaminase subunit PdxT [Allonocardiopsis opalescens]|uniref:Pyridoxal 5'-phosphate synthase subunit PdxT n=1 Tax=Allonocardiopsis opalescens TaxID=1144618 RepID=A0A2T0PXD7_9ACTN|nr:pyridoxal 5'-phosphate synthase glutaminase subunit PdxT [Allonocardiopsis opalescens]PRX96056.1 5'-phosphate synthase pdxT subunit [Allonocardiopsis opalescens]